MASRNFDTEKLKEINTRVPKTPENKQVYLVAPLNSFPYVDPSPGLTSPFLSVNNSNDNAKIKVTRTGSASLGVAGPPVGLLDFVEFEQTYHFRVSLPGVSKDPNEFKCHIEENGKVTIKGITLTGEKTVCRDSQVFKMLTRNLCPPGEFTLTIQLPGPVCTDEVCNVHLSYGSLKYVVKKKI